MLYSLLLKIYSHRLSVSWCVQKDSSHIVTKLYASRHTEARPPCISSHSRTSPDFVLYGHTFCRTLHSPFLSHFSICRHPVGALAFSACPHNHDPRRIIHFIRHILFENHHHRVAIDFHLGKSGRKYVANKTLF